MPETSAAAPSREQLLAMYRKMLLIRRFEERAGQQYGLGRIGGFCHLYVGQEAVAVGTIAGIGPQDYAIAAYRDHGHALACGSPPGPLMAELFGRGSGPSKGRGGSMHLFDRDHRFLGGYGIVGGEIPLGTGVAFAMRYRGESRCCLCFMGDAAINQGSFHESLNLASLWKLPVIYVIENNRYGMGTRVDRSTSIDELFRRADAYRMPGEPVDGMDVIACWQAARRAAERARAGEGPTLLEARTYRYRGHSMADPATYRTKEEVEEERRRDPILKLRAQLLEGGHAKEEDLVSLEGAVRTEIDGAVKFAEAAPEPPDEGMYEDVYSPAIPVDRLEFTGD